MKISPANLAYVLYCASLVGAAPVVKRATSYSGGTTASDVDSGLCAPVTLIFARGSTEPGNMGASVGPALAKALIEELGADGVAIQGVDYSATIASNISMGSDGGPELAQLAQKAKQQCPDTKIAISGYSQGGTVCSYALGEGGLSADNVAAAVLYGSPTSGQTLGDLPSSQTKDFCATGDGVCTGGGFAISAAHLSYTTDGTIQEGAQFIVQAAGSSSGGSSSSGNSTPSGTSAAPASASSSSSSSSSSSGGLGGLGGSSSGGLGGLGDLGSLGGSSGSGLGDLGSLGGSSSSGLGGLGSLGGTSTSPLGGLSSGTSTGGLGSLGGLSGSSSTSPFGGLTSGISSGGLGSLGSGSSGSGGLSGIGKKVKRFF